MSSGRKEDWFDIDKCIVVPDRSINLTAVVDTVTTDYDVVRGERNDIENPDVLKRNIARATGVPLTKQGLERKIGRAIIRSIGKAIGH